MTLTTIIVALITAVFGPVAVEWTKKKLNKPPKKDDILQEAIEYNDLVIKQIESLMEHLNCSRIWISQFHNGGHFYPTGKSIQKFSTFYEKISPQSKVSKSIQPLLTNIPVSIFPRPLTKLKQNGEFQIIDFSKDENYGLDVIANEYKIKSLYVVTLTDLDDKFIGMIHISYDKTHELTHEEWIFLRQKVGVIGSLLTEYLHHSLTK